MHTNSGACLGCAKIFNAYPGFYAPLKEWFFNVQEKFPTFHISCAGRGRIEQEAAFHRGASSAHWLESAHSFNAAIDTFFQVNGNYSLDENLYEEIVKFIDPTIEWYGNPLAKFKELPHFQLRNWRDFVKNGQLRPVE